MDATYNTTAIVLRREGLTGDNSRVFVYSKDCGKLHLVARGTTKLSSKLAAHIEPLNLCSIMVIKGKQYDYAGSCVSEEVFSGIKNSYECATTAGTVVGYVDRLIKEHEPDERIFNMLYAWLQVVDAQADVLSLDTLHLLSAAFQLKFIAMLGYAPKLDELRVGDRSVGKPAAELMTRFLWSRFEEVVPLTVEDVLIGEVSGIVNDYRRYVFD